MPPYIHPNAKKPKSKPWSRPFSNTPPLSSQTANEKRLARFQGPTAPKDPLESAGLPSKGDTSLLNHAAQEAYYTLLTSRYMDWCAATGNPSVADATARAGGCVTAFDADLSQSFGDMSIDGESFCGGGVEGVVKPSASKAPASKAPASKAPVSKAPTSASSAELDTLHMSMRKLREALLSTGRADSFAQQVYMFIIRASLLSRRFESYHPALLHLLHTLHPRMALSSSTLHEFVGYQILDTACRIGDYGEAYALRLRWGFTDAKVDGILRALVRDEWVAFWRVGKELDGYQRALVRWAEDGVRKHVLKCVGGAYLSLARGFVERGVGCGDDSRRERVVGGGVERVVGGGGMDGEVVWSDVVRQYDLKWEEDGNMLVVKRVKNAGKKSGR